LNIFIRIINIGLFKFGVVELHDECNIMLYGLLILILIYSLEMSDFMYKVILVGDTSVGKSSVMRRFADDSFSESYLATIGVDFKFK
jgi:GTPase SAR1 family protein